MKNKLLLLHKEIIMYSFYGLVIQLLIGTVVLATEVTHAQKNASVKDTNISFQFTSKNLETVFREIEEKTDFTFVYTAKEIDTEIKMNGDYINAPLYEVLMDISKKTNLAFRQYNNNITVKKAAYTKRETTTEFVEIVQDVDISGKITDENGEGLPGASVVAKGTANGTTTDLEGNYKMEVPENSVLVVSYVGYITQEVTPNGRNVIDLQLQLDAAQLEEIVVVGYGTQKKSEMTGSVASIDNVAIADRPISNFVDVLQGNAAGVAVNSTSGAPGSGVQVRIRGIGSINSQIDPLYVVDGLPFTGSLNSINAYDIESIEVLKDASATAIYGSRGSNGVILITTKKGTNGLTIDYNGSYNIQSLRKKMDLLDATQYAQLANEAELAIGNPERYSSSDIAAFHNNGKGTDWQDEIYRNAIMQNHQISVRGGNEKMKFYMSGNYLNQEGIVKTSQFEKYTMRANIDADITKKLSVGNTLSINRQFNSGVAVGTTTRDNNGDSNVVWAALVTNPTLQIKDEDGNFNSNVPDPIFDNPVALINGNLRQSNTTEIIGSLYLNYDLFDWLSIKSTFGFGLLNSMEGKYTKKFIIGSSDGRAIRNTNQNSNWISTTQLNINKEFGEIHKLNATLVTEAQEVQDEAFSATATGFVVDNLLWNNLSSGSVAQTPTSSASKWSLLSYLTRINYVLNDKYLLTVSGRYDGSSRLAQGNKWYLFPSGALSWRVSEESFMSSVNAVDELKFRVSYGESGNQSVGTYNTLSRLTSVTAIIGANENQNIGFAPANFVNEDLTWEISKQLDIGADVTFLEGRVGLTVDYFNRKTEGLFFNKALPSVVGTTGVAATTNIGSVRNKGLELEVDATVLDVEGFRWDVMGNFTYTKNKVLALAENDTIITGFSGDFGNGSDSQILAVGGQLGVFQGYLNDGLYDSDASLTIDGSTRAPGDLKYVDVNEDGNIDSKDKVVLGTGIPNKFWGLTNTFGYKGLSLSVFLMGSHGNKLVNLTRQVTSLSLDGKSNNNLEVLNRWTPQNTNTNIPRATALRPSTKFSDSWLEDGSYIRLKTITLGYQLPQYMLEKLNVRMLKLYVTATNLITFTKYTGYDPDVSVSGSVTQQGFDQGVYPQVKSFMLGLNIGF
ncbi:SusC/RagA family TonB-linked outer membrane protein [Reichenbachiella sp. MALMAid0571]|uniref:SusC/RagA family TonB-linked outer membrane protein n=1 Tax=Reichenbachiella sp. MALMAid0571 TaxID=3143939 RepID=UPI0032DE556B